MEEKYNGKELTPKLLLEIKSDYDKYRVIYPNSVITMDYRLDRINISVDNNDIITNVWIG